MDDRHCSGKVDVWVGPGPWSRDINQTSRGSCGPLSAPEARKGGATTIVCRVMSLGGTASSKPNDRTRKDRSDKGIANARGRHG